MKVIGLIGGIGSGKSEISRLLEARHGFRVFRTDEIAAELMQPGTKLMEALHKAFPASCFQGDGSIDKKAYGALIYSDPSARSTSDALVHPAVWQEVEERMRQLPEGTDCCIETALPGGRLRELCTELWYVYAPVEVRLDRLTESRGYTRERALSIMENQESEEGFFCMADYVITNDGSLEDADRRIEELLESTGQQP